MKRKGWQCRCRSKIVYIVMLCFCVGSLVMLQNQFIRITDSGAAVPPPAVQKPKIAFLFIARNRLPLEMVWDAFFWGEKEEGRFSIYVHSRPGFILNEVTTRSPFFYNRQVNNSVQVDWGESSMLEAERILLKNALKDPFNERFVFLSDSCIPLYNFSYTYNYILSTSTSFVDRINDGGFYKYSSLINIQNIPQLRPSLPPKLRRILGEHFADRKLKQY